MDKIKIYKNSYDDKFVKVKVEFILDVPIDEDITKITKKEVYDAIMEIDSSDLAYQIFVHMNEFHIVTNSDNIKHVEKIYKQPHIDYKPIEIEYISLELINKIIKSEMNKGNKFAEIFVSHNQQISSDDLETIKQIGFNVDFNGNRYWITWDN